MKKITIMMLAFLLLLFSINNFFCVVTFPTLFLRIKVCVWSGQGIGVSRKCIIGCKKEHERHDNNNDGDEAAFVLV